MLSHKEIAGMNSETNSMMADLATNGVSGVWNARGAGTRQIQCAAP